MTNNKDFRVNQISQSLYEFIDEHIGMFKMNTDEIDDIVFEFSPEKKILSCYRGFIEKKYLIKDIECEIMQFFTPDMRIRACVSLFAPGAYEKRLEIRWGLKKEVVKFRKELAAKLLEGT